MRLTNIPRIDPHQLNRNNLKVLKLKGSIGGQATALVEKTGSLAMASQGTISPNNFALTSSNSIAKKLNVI